LDRFERLHTLAAALRVDERRIVFGLMPNAPSRFVRWYTFQTFSRLDFL
jgi:hypothetical protein